MKFYRVLVNDHFLSSNAMCEACKDKAVETHKCQLVETFLDTQQTAGQCLRCSTVYARPVHRSSVTIHYKGADERHPF